MRRFLLHSWAVESESFGTAREYAEPAEAFGAACVEVLASAVPVTVQCETGRLYDVRARVSETGRLLGLAIDVRAR